MSSLAGIRHKCLHLPKPNDHATVDFVKSTQPKNPEAAILERLSREITHIFWAHRVRLTSPALRLTDSLSYWAVYDPNTITISIARRLITEYDWFSVTSVLRHELAHHFVAQSGRKETAHHHGPEFIKACQKLGVPTFFWGATCNLQTFRPVFSLGDLKTAEEDSPQVRHLEKIKKLLALAGSANENEALIAMNKVRELSAKFQLETLESPQEPQIQQLRDTLASTDFKNSPITATAEGIKLARQGQYHVVLSLKKKRVEAHLSKICTLLSEHFFVRVIYFTEFEIASGKDFQAIQLIGSRENVLMAEYVYHFLKGQIDSLVREKKKTSGLSSRLSIKSYRLGVLAGFSQKLKATNERAQSEYKNPKTSETGLVVLGKALSSKALNDQIDSYVETVFPRLVSRSRSRQWVDGKAYSDGTADGKSITLHRAMTSRGESGRFLR